MGPSQHSVRNGFEREGTLREMHTLELKKVIQKCGTKIAKRNIWQYNFLVQHVMEDKLLIPVVRYVKTAHIVERK